MRGGSKGVNNKCLKKINGKPLLEYTIKQAKRIDIINNIVISTDSKKIINLSANYGIKNFFIRPKYLSKDNSPKIPVIRDAVLRSEKFFNKKFDIIIDLDVSSPLRSIEDIKNAYNKFLSSKSDILFTVNKSKKNPYFNMVEIKNNKVNLIKKNNFVTRRQDAPEVFDVNSSIYIWKRKTIINNDTLFTKKTSIFEMPEERSIDIDTIFDFKLVEFLLKKNKHV